MITTLDTADIWTLVSSIRRRLAKRGCNLCAINLVARIHCSELIPIRRLATAKSIVGSNPDVRRYVLYGVGVTAEGSRINESE